MSSTPPLVACWLDSSIGEAGTHLDLKRHFEGISKRIIRWYYFDSGDQFCEFIDGNPNMRLVTIMSGNFAKTLVSKVSDRPSLHSVYVFCGNLDKYKQLPSQEKKIKGVFDSEHILYQTMYSDLQNELL